MSSADTSWHTRHRAHRHHQGLNKAPTTPSAQDTDAHTITYCYTDFVNLKLHITTPLNSVLILKSKQNPL